MGYDLHITRRTDWSDDGQQSVDISINEWLAYVEQDKELELSDEYWVKVPGSQTESHVSPGYCKWTKHPNGFEAYFAFSDGSISEKNPDDFTIKKMYLMSKILNAYLQGDDGEIYEVLDNGNISTTYLEEDGANNQGINADKKPWWKFW
jgi:hypothetical protein